MSLGFLDAEALRAERRSAPHDVYWIYDDEDRVLYIGHTRNLEQRLVAHSKKQPWWDRVSRIEATSYENRPAAMAAEGEAIRNERPPFNRQIPKATPTLPPIIRRDEQLHAVEVA